jgi:hypothetical protein
METKRKITNERIIEAVDADDNIGFCLACGAENYGCEPDMRRGKCDECGALKVYGAEELMMMRMG